MRADRLILAAFTIAAGPVAAQSTPPTSDVRASASATISLTPDVAIITVQYSANGRTPGAAGRAAAARAAQIRAAIEALGIPRDSMPTTGRWGRWGNRSDMQLRNAGRDTLYVTNDAFTVRVRDFNKIGAVIDTALAEGAQTISNVQFQASNTSAAALTAIKEATTKARAYAQAIASASGLTLGNAIELTSGGEPMVMDRTMQTFGAMKSAAAVATEVVAPELSITMTVSGRWELVRPAR